MIIGCFAGCKKKAESTYSEKTASESINTSLQQQSSSQQSTQSTISNSMDNDYVTQNKKFMNISNPRDLVEIYDNYTNMGFCCNYVDVNVSSVYNILTENQKQWVNGVVKSTCCHTIADAKAHIKHYIDSSLLGKIYEDCFLEYNGELYMVLGAKGYVSHDYKNMDIQELSNGEIIILADSYGSGDNFTGVEEFTIKKINNTFAVFNVRESR